MKITSMEITEKDFKKVLRGYSVDEVDEFLDKISDDYEAVLKENATLKEKLGSIQEKIDHYNKMENTIQNTLLLAQNASEQARENAQKESELIIKNANEAAQRIIDKAHSDIIQINDEFERVKQDFCKFRTKYRGFITSQLEMFDDMEKEFVKNYNIGYETSENTVAQNKKNDMNHDSIYEKEIEVSADDNLNSNEVISVDEDIENNGQISGFLNDENELREIKNFFVKD
ncbi:DivIVA domain-containing protein [Clostridium fermenticellae]|uniref:DivIVA domain-containing protein n=1 Tax=Clostridium fermenticellae TaxID=2068654 RepID=A0A386H4S1_9CLOT|nr:DivIVA domain-containing protein [Clostridium fermenticellae]AYD40624.1 DivIVA domain-containing protein [Clostridium fermenticellae]